MGRVRPVRHLVCVLLVALAARGSANGAPPVVNTTEPPMSENACARTAGTLVKAWSHRWSGSEVVSGPNEQDIATAKLDEICKNDKWAVTVEQCIAGRGDPWRCVDQAKLVERLPPAGLALSCEDAVIHDVRAVGVYADTNEALRIGHDLLKDELAATCRKQSWSHTMLGCLWQAGAETAMVRACQERWLTEDQSNELTGQLDVFALIMERWSASPPSCDEVAMAYYSDEAWANHPTTKLSAAARKKAIADSRKKLVAHCKNVMSPVLRGCVAAAASAQDAWACWWNSDDHSASRWSFPADAKKR